MDIRDARDRIIVALDVPALDQAKAIVAVLPDARHFKIGMELFTAVGPDAVHMVHDAGKDVFFDQKNHDIPNTVRGAAAAATRLRVQMFNVHCLGGIDMMAAAQQGVLDATVEMAGVRYTHVLGVTVLTSHTYESLLRLGLVKRWRELFDRINWDEKGHHRFEQDQVRQCVVRLAKDAKDAGLYGVVASPQEIVSVREACGPKFIIVTPGIRPAGASADDQQRIATPAAATRAGADYLVVGRPITAASDKAAAFERIAAEVAADA